MRLMRLMPIYQKPNTSRPAKGHKTYPYLLGGLRVALPNLVWCADITYLPMRRGFLCLVAIMDWFTSKVLAWRISNTLEADFCVEALNEAIHKFGPPEIMNTDQGTQFTSLIWTDRLKRVGTRISMDGKGRCLDNIFIERLSRSLKYECVYLHAWETGSQTQTGIAKWIAFLQQPATSRRPWRTAARRGPLHPDRNRPTGAESSLNYAENCPTNGEPLTRSPHPGRDEAGHGPTIKLEQSDRAAHSADAQMFCTIGESMRIGQRVKDAARSPTPA